jgi:hypothetical protein
LQLENDDVLLLAGLPQVLVGHALLDQLPGEPRDLHVLELEGNPCLLQPSVLPLELDLRFLPDRALALKGSLGLLEGGLLLLGPSLRLLARALLLAELLPHRSKRGDLIRQVSSQPLGLLGFLLVLGLPRLRPLEGGAILLELSLRRGEGRLPLRRYVLHLSQGCTRLLQSLVPLQECVLHHVNRRTALRSQGALVQERILHVPQLAVICP